jgi:hypothetical protein
MSENESRVPEDRMPDYFLHVTVRHQYGTTKDVPCKVFLPKTLMDKPLLIFQPTAEQSTTLRHLFEFRVSAEFESGSRHCVLQAPSVYSKGLHQTAWGPGIKEFSLTGEAWDLTITRRDATPSTQAGSGTRGFFQFTPNHLLRPEVLIHPHMDGNIETEEIRPITVTLCNGFALRLRNSFSYSRKDNDEAVLRRDLVAEFDIALPSDSIFSALKEIDDLLVLASFAARYRTVCVGFSSSTSDSEFIEHYRRGIALPANTPKRSEMLYRDLIDTPDFPDFLKAAYENYVQTQPFDLLKQAITYLVPMGERTLESSFSSLFYGLETLVRVFRHQSKFTRGSASPLKPPRQDMTFAKGWQNLCAEYGVDVADLWPVVGTKNGISLTAVRNRLVHGDIFTPPEGYALMAAREHLQWVLERTILTILGWPIDRSNVSTRILQSMSLIYDFAEDQKRLEKRVNTAPPIGP